MAVQHTGSTDSRLHGTTVRRGNPVANKKNGAGAAAVSFGNSDESAEITPKLEITRLLMETQDELNELEMALERVLEKTAGVVVQQTSGEASFLNTEPAATIVGGTLAEIKSRIQRATKRLSELSDDILI